MIFLLVGRASLMKLQLRLFTGYWNWMCRYGSPKLKNIFEMVCNFLSHWTILTIIHDHLEKKKVSVKWVPKILIDNHKMNHIVATAWFLILYNAEGGNLFDELVTGDKKWGHHFIPQVKVNLKQCVAVLPTLRIFP